MISPNDLYSQDIQLFTALLKKISNRIYLIGTLRLLVTISACLFTWLLWQYTWQIIGGVLLAHFILFAFLLKINHTLVLRKEYNQHRIQIAECEQKGLNYDFSSFDGFPENINHHHAYSSDLDIFGDKSLFQSINRTGTFFGKKKLAGWFENLPDNKNEILERRKAIQEIAGIPELFLHFKSLCLSCESGDSDQMQLMQFGMQSDLIKNKSKWRVLSVLFPVGWLIVFILLGLKIVSFSFVVVLFIVCLLVSYSKSKKTTRLNRLLEDKVKILTTYSSLLEVIEKQHFSSEKLIRLQARLVANGSKSSVEIRKLASLLRSLDLKNTFPAGLLFNVFMLWEISYAMKIERWKNQHRQDLEIWLENLADFDAFISLGMFAFNHPSYTYPEIADEYFCFRASDIGHPLIHPDVCVKNDVEIPRASYFLIVTGANMAGKSTYLRTIGVNFLLACLGTPVCAKSMIFSPAKLMSSLRTADSLMENESYFFAELKRLSNMIKKLQEGEKLFIILDEILKGTNSTDKQKGSMALIRQLLSLQASGIIATHDLSLGKLEELYPEQIRNNCFDADIIDDELHFSYKLRLGIAQNMNACFLMKKMGIIVED